MKRSLNSLFHALALATSVFLSAAQAAGEPAKPAADLVFSSGRLNSAYWGVANRFKKVASGAGLNVDVQESVGSLQNLERMEDANSPVNMALTQSDALHEYLEQHPSLVHKLTIVESIGLECVFMITTLDKDVSNESDLAGKKGFRIAVPAAESGAAVTYRNLTQLNTNFAGTEVVYADAATAMKSLQGQGGQPVDALMIVLRPKERTPELEQALDSPDKFRLVSFHNRTYEARLPDGQAIYNYLDLPLARQKAKVIQSLPTLCTTGVLVANPSKLTNKSKEGLEKVVGESWMQIYSKDY